jgi:hypothetical protein
MWVGKDERAGSKVAGQFEPAALQRFPFRDRLPSGKRKNFA